MLDFDAAQRRGLSQRAAAEEAGVPRSTVRHWNGRRRGLDLPDPVAAFLETPEGLAWLHQLVLSAVFVITLRGPEGIRLVCEFLELSGLAEVVAASFGAVQKLTLQMQKEVTAFGAEQREHLGQSMPPKAVTVCEDETFHPAPCLVAIELALKSAVADLVADIPAHWVTDFPITPPEGGKRARRGEATLGAMLDSGFISADDLVHEVVAYYLSTKLQLTHSALVEAESRMTGAEQRGLLDETYRDLVVAVADKQVDRQLAEAFVSVEVAWFETQSGLNWVTFQITDPKVKETLDALVDSLLFDGGLPDSVGDLPALQTPRQHVGDPIPSPQKR